MGDMMKKKMKMIIVIIVVLLIIMYSVPVEFNHPIPKQPTINSVFKSTDQNITIHSEVIINDPQQTTLVFLHGLGAGTHSFHQQLPFFSDNDYNIIAMDIPPFGYSEKSLGFVYSRENIANQLWQVIDQINQQHQLSQEYVFVSHSMGSSIMIAMNNQRPNDIRATIMIAPAIVESNTSSWWFVGPIRRGVALFLRYGGINEANIKRLLTSAANSDIDDDWVNRYLTPLQTKNTIRALNQMVATSNQVTMYDWIAPLNDILIIWGDQDEWLDKRQLTEIAIHLPEATIVTMPQSGHLPHESDAKQVNEIILSFLLSLQP